MPRPAYIICAESGANDKETSRLSHFNVIERLQVGLRVHGKPSRNRKATILAEVFSFHIYAVWALGIREKMGDEYDFEMSIKRPWDAKAKVVHQGKFVFAQFNQKFIVSAKIGISDTANIPGLLRAGKPWVPPEGTPIPDNPFGVRIVPIGITPEPDQC